MGRILPWLYGLVLVGEALILTVVYALWMPRASDPISVWLATLGIASMVLMLAYSLARRSRTLRRVARLSYWLHLHIFLGLQGVLFVVFHSLPLVFRLPRIFLLNPGVLNLLACLTVFASGIFGRYLFAQVPKTLGGQHMQIKEVEAEIASLDGDVPKEVAALWRDSAGAHNVLELVRADVSRRSAIRKIRRMDLSPELRDLAVRRLRLESARAVLNVAQRWFRWWIFLHRPIAAAMYLLTFVHVAVAVMFSPMRFF